MVNSKQSDLLKNIGQYKSEFKDPENYFYKSGKGLNRKVVENISMMKKEPDWMLEFRLKALDHYLKMFHWLN